MSISARKPPLRTRARRRAARIWEGTIDVLIRILTAIPRAIADAIYWWD
ncbi:hypothetical protein KHO57_gp004 [Mycobacterium phage Phabba]|uniref:Uncharacterized protein n=1 Tax=Mycobacterium phage Phabba TaxID=2027899 RepID=A0A249XS70_9CAUD|nr:hypothetical protein KHO57_gp004 [Mycobacterium phage Phabba]ASZ74579.1 hypothetical protein SEA_PHABBA_4 [Mycobacterium phage Phabba]